MNILLAEDDTFFQNFYSKKLSEQGITVTIAKDGEEALMALQTARPDLILLDLIMPKKDGFDVLTELGKNEQLKTIPVIVFSTLGQEGDMIKAKNLGAKDFVNKTFFDFSNLLLKIKTIVANTPTAPKTNP